MKSRKATLQTFPNPPGKILAGRILEPVNLVQIIVVQPLMQRFECVRDLGIVDEPTCLRVNLSAHRDFTSERMPVQTRTLMILGHEGQAVRGLKGELFDQVDDHRQQS